MFEFFVLKKSRPLSFISVLLFLLAGFFSFPGLAGASPVAGKKIFFARGCAGCHNVKGLPAGETIKTFSRRKGPELWYSGSKFRDGFIERWLKDPRPLRPLKYNSLKEKNRAGHVRLSAGEAREVAGYLMSLKSTGVKAAGIRPGVDVNGRIVFIKKFACYSCHRVRVRGKAVGGVSGPDLIGVDERLNPDWIFAFLADPRAFRPVSRMPVYKGLMSEKDLRALSSYVAGLR
ncbi:MAG: hypothetical protein BMS9Abin23_0340 [Thermodesulfobacteriota bacterium]|nr:MAG: hypothetical protein BMS9Abin23_0340 [Thermodesulfobacteriota bacterium]